MIKISRLLLAVVAASAFSYKAHAQIDSEYYYTLTTQFRGSGMKLDVYNGGAKNHFAHLSDGNKTGHYWHLGTPDADGWFYVANRFTREGLCLDVVNGGPDNNQLRMTQCGNYSGQKWRLIRVGRYYQIKSQFRGALCLDIINGGPNNNLPHLTTCNLTLTGQRWVVRKTNVATAGDNYVLETVQKTPLFGGAGGGNFEISCPHGSVMTGIEAHHGEWIDALSPVCSYYLRSQNDSLAEAPNPQPFAGRTGAARGFIRCENSWGVLTGLELHQARNRWGSIGHITVNCGKSKDPGQFANKFPGSAPYLGNSQQGSRHTVQCPPPLVAGGIYGRAGNAVDALGLMCVQYKPR